MLRACKAGAMRLCGRFFALIFLRRGKKGDVHQPRLQVSLFSRFNCETDASSTAQFICFFRIAPSNFDFFPLGEQPPRCNYIFYCVWSSSCARFELGRRRDSEKSLQNNTQLAHQFVVSLPRHKANNRECVIAHCTVFNSTHKCTYIHQGDFVATHFD